MRQIVWCSLLLFVCLSLLSVAEVKCIIQCIFLLFCLFLSYACVVCRSHSNSTDYGGDNFDVGHSEGFSLSSDYDVSLLACLV